MLPEQHQEAEGRGDRDDVEQHRFERQHHRAQRPHEQQEGRQADQAQHERQPAEDRVAVVEDGGARTGDADDAGDVGHRVPDAGHDGGPLDVDQLLLRHDVHDRAVAQPPRRVVRRHGEGDTGDVLEPLHHLVGALRCVLRAHEHLERRDQSCGDTAVPQRLQRLDGRTARGEGVGAGLADPHVEDRHHEQPDEQRADPGGEPAVPDHATAPRGPGRRRRLLVPQPRPVDAGSDAREHGRQQREDDRGADERDEGAAHAHALQEGHRHDDERDQ